MMGNLYFNLKRKELLCLLIGTTLCDTPRVRITNVGRNANQPTEVQLTSYYTFTANIELRCATIWTQNMSWIIANTSLNDFEAISNGTVVSAKTNDWTPTVHHAAFANVVHTLYFSFTVVQQEGKVTKTAYDKGYLIIRLPPLEAKISGETEITRGNKQIFILNGSESYDPHVGHGDLDTLTFYWLCKRLDEEFPTENPLAIQVVQITLSHSKASRGGCFGTGIGRLKSTEPVIMLNASVMENSTASYVFKLIVTKDVRSASDEKIVHVVEGSPPEVSLKLVY